MPLLNDADKVYVGASEVRKVYLGANLVREPDAGGVVATGGIVTDLDGFRYHKLTMSGDFVVTEGGEVEYLVVSGGGAGSNTSNGGAGGGGAGGLLTSTVTVTAQTYPVVVGAGGDFSNGNDSSFHSVSTLGGGRGANVGGSGGGGGSGAGGTGVVGQGNDGGDGTNGTEAGAGGGGAGQSGGDAGPLARDAGDGGNGLEVWGNWYAGGGGGSNDGGGDGSYQSLGGLGGGGRGTSGTLAAESGEINTGGGGGGSRQGSSGNGGSGIVVIRYSSPSWSVNPPSIVSRLSGSSGSGTSISTTTPSDLEEGDLYLISFQIASGSGPQPVEDGWTGIGLGSTWTFSRIASISEPATYNWTMGSDRPIIWESMSIKNGGLPTQHAIQWNSEQSWEIEAPAIEVPGNGLLLCFFGMDGSYANEYPHYGPDNMARVFSRVWASGGASRRSRLTCAQLLAGEGIFGPVKATLDPDDSINGSDSGFTSNGITIFIPGTS